MMHVFRRHDVSCTVAEAIVAAQALAWAFTLLLFRDTFSETGTRNFVAMSEFAPEVIWGGIFLGVGALQAVGIYLHWRAGKEIRWLRTSSLILSAVLFGFLSGMFAANDMTTPAWLTNGVLSLAAIYSAMKAQT